MEENKQAEERTAREGRLRALMPRWMRLWRAEYRLIKAIFKSSGWNLIDDLDTIWMLRPWKPRTKQ